MSTIRLTAASIAAAALSLSVIADGRIVVNAAPADAAAGTAQSATPSGAPVPVQFRATIAGGQASPTTTLQPRERIQKTPTNALSVPVYRSSGLSAATGRVLVKFDDHLKVRAPRTPSMVVQTADGVALPQVTSLLSQFGATAWQALDKPAAWFNDVEGRASSRSGIASPDLAGILYVVPGNDDLEGCARAFNELPGVEFVVIEQQPKQAMQAQAGAQTDCAEAPGGACQLAPGAVNCNKPGIPPTLPNANGRCTNFAIGGSCTNLCLTPCDMDVNDPDCIQGCNDLVCCPTVIEVLPGCKDGGGWDGLCAAYANSICNRTVYDPFLAVGGNNQSVPGSYKYDPCYALRTGPNPGAPDVSIQATFLSALGYPAAATFPFELVAVTGFSTAVTPAPMGDSGLVSAVAAIPVDPAFPSTAQFAMQDPSFERAPYSISSTCLTIHPGRRGCNNTPCCVYVCLVDPTCCITSWDADCVRVASTANGNNPCLQPLAGSIPASVTPGPADFPLISMTNFPAGGATPNFAPTVVDTGYGKQSRNLQAWGVGAPSASSLEPLQQDPAIGVFAVAPPTTQAALSSSRLFLNSGYRGGGFDFTGFEAGTALLGISSTASRGDGITIGVVDESAFVNHEDLAGRVTVEPGYEVVTNPLANVDPHHGTAVLGIMLAANNGIGITGAAPNATGIFYPSIAGAGVGARFFNAIGSAVGGLEAGDVICIPLDYPTVVTDPLTGQVTVLQGTVLQSPEVYLLAQVASAIGITMVVAAGNECSPVDTSPGNAASSAAIVVGAVWPGQPRFGALFESYQYCRSDFSNFSGQAAPERDEVDVAGWGAYVTTCGYGDLWRGNSGGDNNLRTYTLQFGGTSAASAMIAGCIARIQGAATVLYGTPLTPPQIKSVVKANRFLQCGLPNDSPFQLTSSDDVCAGDTVVDGDFNAIGGFFKMGAQVVTTLTNEPIGAYPENITSYEIQVLIGRLLSGSVFSLLSADNNYLRIQAARSGGVSNPQVGPAIFYPSTAVISDLLLTVNTLFTEPQQLFNLSITALGQAVPNNNVYTIFYVFNVQTQRWMMLPDTLTFFQDEAGEGPDVLIASGGINQLYNVINLIDTSSGFGKVRFRIVTIGPQTTNSYQAWWELITVNLNPPLNPPDPCWVAREVYGASNPRWVLFREWLMTSAPVGLRTAYETFGERTAAWLHRSPVARAAIRPLLDAAIDQLDHAQRDRALRRFGQTPEGKALMQKGREIGAAAHTAMVREGLAE